MALTTSERISIKRKSAEEIAEFIQNKRFTRQDLEELAKTDTAFADVLQRAFDLLEQLPDPDETAAFEQLKAAITNDIDNPETESKLNSYLSTWQNRPSAAANVATARTLVKRLAARKSFRELSTRMDGARQAYASSGRLTPGLGQAVRNFVQMHSSTPLCSPDIQQAGMWLQELKAMYAKEISNRWGRLFNAEGKLNSLEALDNFLRTMPVDSNMRTKADESAWEWVHRQPDLLDAANRYDAVFQQQGLHAGEVQRIRDSASQWQLYSQLDIYSIINFLEDNPDHPFADAAGARIRELKAEALAALKADPAPVSVPDFRNMLQCRYFTREELMEASGMDEEMLRTNVDNYERQLASLPPLPNSESVYGSGIGEPGLTDVVFFGIQSSGKTCVLSGLLRHDNLWFDERRYSGDYGATLRAYAQKGFAVSGTPRNFVATIKAEVSNMDPRYIYKFNLFEMAGEDFRSGIAHGMDQYGRPALSFDDMGANAAEILRTGNDKVFFLLIDPTTDYLQQSQQASAMNALLSLMFGDGNGYNPNEDIMRRVQGLHFIITKSDTLKGAGDIRELARNKVYEIINPATRKKIVDGCIQYGINASKDPAVNGHPRVFPFSLGHFTIGNMFRYDPAGASTILRVICDYCAPERRGSGAQKFRSFFTNPII